MTNRDRFRAAMEFAPTDRPCHVEYGFWPQTIAAWREQGLPDAVRDPPFAHLGEQPDLFRHFDVTRCGYILPSQYLLDPADVVVLEDTDSYVMTRDALGRTIKHSKRGASLPGYVDYRIRSRRDYEELKHQLRPAPHLRYGENWNELAQRMRQQKDVLVCTHMDGFFAYPRELMGVETTATMFYDDPDFMHDLTDDRCEFYMQVYERAIRDTKPDFAFIWEDMCFRNGPLVSPALFREFMLPAYQKLTSFLRGMGVEHIVVDSDGDLRLLIALWLEGGVTGLLPFEVKTGMDLRAIAEDYPTLRMFGGIDKHVLETTPAAIDRELQRVLPAMLQRGGYVVTLDHWVQPEIPMANFQHYVNRVREMSQTSVA